MLRGRSRAGGQDVSLTLAADGDGQVGRSWSYPDVESLFVCSVERSYGMRRVHR